MKRKLPNINDLEIKDDPDEINKSFINFDEDEEYKNLANNIIDHPNLSKLTLSNAIYQNNFNFTIPISIALSLKEISYLQINNTNISTESLSLLTMPLMLSGLNTLKLINCNLNENHLDYIDQIVTKSTSLKNLNLSNNKLNGQKYTDTIINILNKSDIISLYLSGNKLISDLTSAFKVKDALTNNHNLKTLHLNNNKIGDDNIKALVPAIKEAKSLTDLSLQNNKLTSEGSQAICTSIANKNLSSLDLSNNNIGDEGANDLAKLLKANHSLKFLFITHNNINDLALRNIFEALSTNTNLQTLRADGNNIRQKDTLEELNLSLDNNKKLNNLSYRGSNLMVGTNDPICRSIFKKIKKNGEQNAHISRT